MLLSLLECFETSHKCVRTRRALRDSELSRACMQTVQSVVKQSQLEALLYCYNALQTTAECVVCQEKQSHLFGCKQDC